MAEKRSRAEEDSKKESQNGGNTAEDRVTKGRKKAEQDVGALDNPDIADEPSEVRHLAYFAGVVAFAFVLNLVAMIVAAGGQ